MNVLVALLLYLAILAYCASLIVRREQRRAKARSREAWAEYHAAVGASQSRHPSRLPRAER